MQSSSEKGFKGIIVPALVVVLAISALFLLPSPRTQTPIAPPAGADTATPIPPPPPQPQPQGEIPSPDLNAGLNAIKNIFVPPAPPATPTPAAAPTPPAVGNSTPEPPRPGVPQGPTPPPTNTDVGTVELSPRGASFTVGGREVKDPAFRKGFMDPYDAQVGDKQAFGIEVLGSSLPVIGVEAIVATDAEQNTYPLHLTKGTPQDGMWQGGWDVKDTHAQQYSIKIVASNAKASSSVVISLK